MGHWSSPSDPWPMWPMPFSWPIWPMTHRPIDLFPALVHSTPSVLVNHTSASWQFIVCRAPGLYPWIYAAVHIIYYCIALRCITRCCSNSSQVSGVCTFARMYTVFCKFWVLRYTWLVFVLFLFMHAFESCYYLFFSITYGQSVNVVHLFCIYCDIVYHIVYTGKVIRFLYFIPGARHG